MRLVAFGCSYTYGLGLEDCFVPPNVAGKFPSKFAWPQLLANELNVDCINKSRPSSSNKEILDTLLQFDFDSNDIVLIMWSFTNRWCTINELNKYTQISQYNISTMKEFELFDTVFTEYDLYLDLIYRSNFAKLFLDNKNIFNYHLTVNPKMLLTLSDVVKKWNNVKFSDTNLDEFRLIFPPALDAEYGTPHPGIEAHRLVAMELYKELSDAHNK